MALLNALTNREIGLAYFSAPSYGFGTKVSTSVPKPSPIAAAKKLSNDCIWLTNLPRSETVHLPANIKHEHFLRQTLDEIAWELGLSLPRDLESLFLCIRRIAQTKDWDASLNNKFHHQAVFQTRFQKMDELNPDWQTIGIEANKRYWGHTKSPIKSLIKGYLYPPKFPYFIELLSIKLPNFNTPPSIQPGNFTKEDIERFAEKYSGFCKISFGNTDESALDFIDTSRTIVTLHEAIFISKVAEMKASCIFYSEQEKHPASNEVSELQNYRFSDSILADSLYMAPSASSKSHEAFLRGNAHAYTALHALHLKRCIDISIIGIEQYKIHFVASRDEFANINARAMQLGFLCSAEGSGNDISDYTTKIAFGPASLL